MEYESLSVQEFIKKYLKAIVAYVLIVMLAVVASVLVIDGKKTTENQYMYISSSYTWSQTYLTLLSIDGVGRNIYQNRDLDAFQDLSNIKNLNSFFKSQGIASGHISVSKINKTLRGGSKQPYYQLKTEYDSSVNSQQLLNKYFDYINVKCFQRINEKFEAMKLYRVKSIKRKITIIKNGIKGTSDDLKQKKLFQLSVLEDRLLFINQVKMNKSLVSLMKIEGELKKKHIKPNKSLKFKLFSGAILGTLFFLLFFRLFYRKVVN